MHDNNSSLFDEKLPAEETLNTTVVQCRTHTQLHVKDARGGWSLVKRYKWPPWHKDLLERDRAWPAGAGGTHSSLCTLSYWQDVKITYVRPRHVRVSFILWGNTVLSQHNCLSLVDPRNRVHTLTFPATNGHCKGELPCSAPAPVLSGLLVGKTLNLHWPFLT